MATVRAVLSFSFFTSRCHRFIGKDKTMVLHSVPELVRELSRSFANAESKRGRHRTPWRNLSNGDKAFWKNTSLNESDTGHVFPRHLKLLFEAVLRSKDQHHRTFACRGNQFHHQLEGHLQGLGKQGPSQEPWERSPIDLLSGQAGCWVETNRRVLGQNRVGTKATTGVTAALSVTYLSRVRPTSRTPAFRPAVGSSPTVRSILLLLLNLPPLSTQKLQQCFSRYSCLRR